MDKLCQNCQAPLAADAPRGLCPACLMKVAMATGTVAGPEKPGFTPPSTQELGLKFPQLEIIELVGRGGMGAVYKARQKELDRIVALKILPPGIGDDAAFAERFAREAKALARLNHPGIVTIHDFGRTDGLYFFVMEFVDGVNLRQLLASARVSPREALAIVPQICDALQFAHDQGIVHRDIKPENILLDRRGRVKVADFGLAKLVESNAPLNPSLSPSDGGRVAGRPGEGKTSALTNAGKVMGTPAYMAPEQVGHPAEVDHRADIYALGVVFYQMLTGELPSQHIEPPSKKVQIDVRLDEVVLRALEKKPELRYQQVSEMKTGVETILNSGSAAALTSGQVEAQGSKFSWVGAFPKLDGPLVLKRGNRRVLNWPVIGISLLVGLFIICVLLPIMLKGMSFAESRASFIELLFLGFYAVVFAIRLVHGITSPSESPPAEPGGAPVSAPNQSANERLSAREAHGLPELRRQQVSEVKTLLKSISTSSPPGTATAPSPARPAAARGRLRAALIVGVLVWLFITGTVTLITWIRAPSWKVVAVISCPWKSQPGRPVEGHFKFIARMIELIRSDVILGRVIDRLQLDERSGKLDERWGRRNLGLKLTKAQAMVLLKRRLDVRSEGGTLIQVSVFGKRPEEPEEAMDIANTIAEELRAFRIEQHDSPADMVEMTLRFTAPDILLGIAAGFVSGSLAGGLVLLFSFWRPGAQASVLKTQVETIAAAPRGSSRREEAQNERRMPGERRSLPWAWAAVASAAVWCLTFLAAACLTFFVLPESFESTARIKTDHPPDRNLFQLEFQLIKSEVILGSVIEDLKLKEVWGRRYNGAKKLTEKQTLELLRPCVELSSARNNGLIEIHVFRKRPDEAASIANAIAEAYRQHRANQRAQLSQDLDKAVKAQLEAANGKIATARHEMDKLQKALNIGEAAAQQSRDPALAEAKERPFWQQKRDLEDLLRFRDELASQVLSQSMGDVLPRTMSVEIVDRAVPALQPARPNKPLNLALGAAGGGVLGLLAGGLVLLFGSRRVRSDGAALSRRELGG